MHGQHQVAVSIHGQSIMEEIGWAASESLLAENTNQKGTNYKWEMCKAGNILSDLAQGKSVRGISTAMRGIVRL